MAMLAPGELRLSRTGVIGVYSLADDVGGNGSTAAARPTGRWRRRARSLKSAAPGVDGARGGARRVRTLQP